MTLETAEIGNSITRATNHLIEFMSFLQMNGNRSRKVES